jgi:hypothetical protein
VDPRCGRLASAVRLTAIAYPLGHAIPPEVPLVLTVICMLVLILSFTVGAYFSGGH